MDWLDSYLNNLADGRNAIYPPDKNTWTPVKPNRQQQSMIQDAVAFDQQQQMRMIQEARADLEAHGMSRDDVAIGIGADPGSPTVQTSDTGAWLTRKIYTEFLGGYGVPNPTFEQLSDAIATWTPVTVDAPTNYVFADFPLGTWEFTGYFVAPEAGFYSFSSSVDDYTFISFGAPVTINNTAHITLQAGEAVPLRILAANVAGPGLLTLLWKNDASQTSNTSNFAGLVYSQLPAGAPVVDPVIPADALNLWLRADAGITPLLFNYDTQIVLAGTVAGTFVATSVPAWNTGEWKKGNYTLSNGVSSISFYMDGYDPVYEIQAAQFSGGVTAGYRSSNASDWTTFGNWSTPPVVSGLTNAFADGNGQYDYSGDNPNNYALVVNEYRSYYIYGSPGAWELWFYDSDLGENYQFASNANVLPNGTWTMLAEDVGTAFSSGSNYGMNPTPPTGVSSTSSLVSTDYIDTWADQSGNNRHAAHSIGAASLSTIADNAFANFPGSSKLNIPSAVLASYTGTVFVVARFASSTDNSVLFFQEDAFHLARGYDGSNTLWVNNGGDQVFSNMQVNNNTNYILETTFDNAQGNLYINGTATGSGPIGDFGVGFNVLIGDGQPSNIAEMIVYNRVLTTAERQKVEAYLAQKYAITLIVPSCTDAEASVVMTGWTAGDRTLTPTNYAPYGYPNYEYGGEVVRYETGVWIYSNVDEGEIVRAYSYEPRPWLATWPQGYTASKVCPS